MNALLAVLLAAAATVAQSPVARVAEDARVIDRVAQFSRGDLPDELLRRLVNEDLDLLRGKRSDGTYAYASYERLEASRVSDSFSIERSDEGTLKKVETKGTFVYRVILEVPNRRLVVARNKPVYVDRVEIEYMPQVASAMKTQIVKIGAWLEPGTVRPIEVEDIGRQTTVQAFARSDPKKGYGNLALTLLQAKVVDVPDSPYADAVASAKAILRGIDNHDVDSVRAMAQRISNSLRSAEPGSVVEVVGARVPQQETVRTSVQPPGGASVDLQELQAIEDLLTGSDAEKRQGMDRLHQLIRRMRTP